MQTKDNGAVVEAQSPVSDPEGPFMAILRNAPKEDLEALKDWIEEHLWAKRWEERCRQEERRS